jgi:hypothetical protein
LRYVSASYIKVQAILYRDYVHEEENLEKEKEKKRKKKTAPTERS